MSKRLIFAITMLSAVISGLIVSGMIILFSSKIGFLQSGANDQSYAGAGHKILMEFQCPYGTTKHLLINGVDDNFAFGNLEPSRRSERLSHLPGHVANALYKRDYDETGNDKTLVDYFEIPENVLRGVFVTRIMLSENYGSDVLSIGDFANLEANQHSLNSYHIRLQDLDKSAAWTQGPGNIYSIRLNTLDFTTASPEYEADIQREYFGLIPYLRSQKEATIIEFMVTDDTPVDFSGMAVCTEPAEEQGVTFVETKMEKEAENDFLLMSCDLEIRAEKCNPFYGDTLCNHSHPVACFFDTRSAVPEIDANVKNYHKSLIQAHWGGGEVNFTPYVRGDTFKTLADVNRYCARTFGEGWRILDFHDGGLKAVATQRPQQVPDSRVWVDIKDQPHGTCWSRADGIKSGEQAPL